MEQEKTQVYARVNENNIVIKIFSSVFEEPLETDVFICKGLGDEYAHPHLKYQLIDYDMHYNYKIIDGKLVERTEEEKTKDFIKI